MGRELSGFSWRVVDHIQKLIAEMDMTDAQVIRRTGISRTAFYTKMRGESAMTTEDIAKIADALQVRPELILRRASRPDVVGDVEDYDVTLNRPDRKSDYAPAAKRGVRKIDR
jgi:transcriptional regulator with XRE-family HTH domain